MSIHERKFENSELNKELGCFYVYKEDGGDEKVLFFKTLPSQSKRKKISDDFDFDVDLNELTITDDLEKVNKTNLILTKDEDNHASVQTYEAIQEYITKLIEGIIEDGLPDGPGGFPDLGTINPTYLPLLCILSFDREDEDDGLTGGQIAGIVLLALGGLGLLIFIIMLIVNSTKKKKKVSFNFMSFQDFIRNH